MNERTISELVLRGIALALNQHAPQLLPIVKRLVQASETEGASGVLGESVYGKLTGRITPEEGKQVADALRAIQSVAGETATFDGRQINFLLQQWEDFSGLPG